MESSSEGAALDLFRVGPTTAVGRALAVQVLLCKSMKEFTLFVVAKIVREWRRMRKWAGFVLGRLLWFVNPRNPSVVLAAVVGAMILLRRFKTVTSKAEQTYRRKFWSNLMKSALTYDEWAHAASMLEKANPRKRDSDLYDEDLVRAKLNELRLRRLEGGVEDILFCLRADLVRNLGNMCNPELHKGRLTSPRLIQEYINEVRYHLRSVCETDSEEFSLEEKIAFIHETRHGFGRTALLLSGGAALGAFHLGVVRTLIEHRLLPRVVAGASVGSITCSFTATRTWSELQSFFDDPMPPMHFFESMGSIMSTAHRLLTRGAVHEIGHLQRKMRQLIGDLTFQEAYDLSGRVLGISVCSPRKHEPPRCLNYLTSPHVVIWSAVTASCAFPGLFEAQELMAKDRHGRLVPYHSPTFGSVGPEELNSMNRQWRDGSLESDLPMVQLKELFNVNHFIVSQANPHIAPLLRLKEFTRAWGGDFAAKLAHITEMEVKHRCSQVLQMGFGLGGLAKLFAQDWEGDITIVMPATFAQFAKIIQNPTPSDLRKAVMQGRRSTWAKLSAIQANCGIELMLDECVSELNRRRKAQKDAQRAAHASNAVFSRTTTKRIPSWNCLARESSWGSLDEDGMMEQGMQQGGPWGGPSLRKLRPVRSSHDGSDSDSGTESMEFNNISWTRTGGPLMRTASALKFILGHESDGNGSELARAGNLDSEDDADGYGRSLTATPTSPAPKTLPWDMRSSKRANKIWGSRQGGSGSGGADGKSDENEISPEDFSFAIESPSLRKSPSSGSGDDRVSSYTLADAEPVRDFNARPACECSDFDKGLGLGLSGAESSARGKGRRSWSGLELDLHSPGAAADKDELTISEANAKEVLRVGTLNSPESEEAQARALQKGAFGSFVVKTPDSLRKDTAA
ncbi:hypothetical protein R1sor_014242 [Riccia sorocarpa]|uniref:PNPLA domain-containing protein n=1 Tax=Riccia sorocarpa TaxID=122646 RepID=A0ABD3H8U0_9MARC